MKRALWILIALILLGAVGTWILVASDGPVRYTVDDYGNVTITGSANNVTNEQVQAAFDEIASEGHRVVAIGSNAFDGRRNLTSINIPDTVTSIGWAAFRSTGLTSVDVPNSVTTIGSQAFGFDGNQRVAGFRLNGSYDVRSAAHRYVIENGFGFNNDPSSGFTTSVQVDQWTQEWSLTITGYIATLAEVVIPSTIHGSPVVAIGSNAFDGNQAITSVSIPDSVTDVGWAAFRGNIRLNSVTIPDSVTSIGGQAFGFISNNQRVANFTIHGSHRSQANRYAIENGFGFNENSSSGFTTSVSIDQWTQEWSLTITGYFATLAEVVIPNEIHGTPVTAIGSNAFDGNQAITSVSLPNSITEIGWAAFRGNTRLTSVTVPDSVTSIGGQAFGFVSNNQRVVGFTLHGSHQSVANRYAIENGFGFNENPSSGFTTSVSIDQWTQEWSLSITGYFATLTEVVIPSEIHGTRVTEIGSNAFSGNQAITSVSIPDSITEIGWAAFRGNIRLTSVSIPDSVTSIGGQAFGFASNNQRIANFTIDGSHRSAAHRYAVENGFGFNEDPSSGFATSVQVDRWTNAWSLTIIDYFATDTIVEIPSEIHGVRVTEIGSNAFGGNQAITSVVIPESVTSIGWAAFRGTTSLQTVDIPASVITIGNNAFQNSNNGLIILGVPDSAAEDYAIENNITFMPSLDHITIVTDQMTNSAQINVSGIARAGSTIRIFEGNTQIATFTASQAHRYSGTVTLRGGFGTRTIRAETTTETGRRISASTTVRFEENAPRLISFLMHHSRRTIDLMATDGVRQTLIHMPGQPFTFEARMENSEGIEQLHFASVRSGVMLRMQATYDPRRDLWVAHGFFDPSDRNYVPAQLSVIVNNNVSILNLDDFEFDLDMDVDDFLQDNDIVLPPEWENAEIEVTENAPDRVVTNITLADENRTTITTTSTYRVVLESAARDMLRNGDFTRAIDVNGRVMYVSNTSTSNTNLSSRTEIIQEMLLPSGYMGWVVTGFDLYTNLASLATQTPTMFGTAVGILYSFFDGASHVAAGGCRLTEVAIFAGRVAISLSAKQVMGAIMLAGPVGWKAVAAAVVVTVVATAAKNFIGWLFRSRANYSVIIDPAGYVYEAVPSNRLVGVTMTAFFRATMDDEPVLWDASEYDQSNPLLTDHEGRYAWDVPEGFWQVRAEMDGFETAYSLWMPVPPPQLNINIGMISRAAPVVESINAYPDAIEIIFNRFMDIDTLTTSNITVSQNGNNIPGTIELVNREWSIDPTSEYVEYIEGYFASTIKFIPNSTLDESVTINISTNVASYAGTTMAQAFTQTLDTRPEPVEIRVQDTDIAFDEYGNIIVTILPVGAAVGQRIIAVSDSPMIASVEREITIGADGRAVIPIFGELPGLANITLTLEGTSLQTQFAVNVDMPGGSTEPNIIPGDVNGDGVVTAADVALLRAYLAGHDVNINRIAANVTGSGTISAADVALLRAYLAGHPVELRLAS